MDKTSQIQYCLIQNCFGDTHELRIQKQSLRNNMLHLPSHLHIINFNISTIYFSLISTKITIATDTMRRYEGVPSKLFETEKDLEKYPVLYVDSGREDSPVGIVPTPGTGRLRNQVSTPGRDTRSSLIWAGTQRVSWFYRRLGTAYRCHLEGSSSHRHLKMGPIACPEASVSD
jgi:hypothetical protein